MGVTVLGLANETAQTEPTAVLVVTAAMLRPAGRLIADLFHDRALSDSDADRIALEVLTAVFGSERVLLSHDQLERRMQRSVAPAP
jgi:hypothetical protein